jgi:DNA-directed RNA polymerase specialized sigma24 family protein
MAIVAAKVRVSCPAGIDRDDAKQEILLAVITAAPKFDPSRAKWSTFVGTIAARRAIDLNRRQTRRQDFVKRLQSISPERYGKLEDIDWNGVEKLTRKLTKFQGKVFRALHAIGEPVAGRAELCERMCKAMSTIRGAERSATLNMLKLMAG